MAEKERDVSALQSLQAFLFAALSPKAVREDPRCPCGRTRGFLPAGLLSASPHIHAQ